MLRQGRLSDSNFGSRDHLYHRCTKEDVEGERLLPARIRVDNTSVNWSKYSEPWDVIFDHPGHGIARFIVRDLPQELPKDASPGPEPSKKNAKQAKLHSFRPSHEPLETNYAHCEIAAYKDEARVKNVRSATIKKEFQTMMSDCSLILLDPEC